MKLRINTPSVTSEIIEGEVVAINLESGFYYSIDSVGAFIWDKINKGFTVEDMTSEVSKHFNIDLAVAQKDINDFVVDLKKESLVAEGEAEASNSILESAPMVAGQYVKPKLVKFDDMQDLLLLDPIHDVDDRGWPNAKAV